MRLVISGGGTGGHVYPLLSVLAALEQPPFAISREDVLYLGTRGRIEEELAQRAGLPLAPVFAGAVRGQGPLELLKSGFLILSGTVQAWSVIRRFRPDAILATGGYVSVPVVLAGWLNRVPILLYLPDVVPGLAVRFLESFASKVAVTAITASSALPSTKTVVTGYPVRPDFGTTDRTAARTRMGLDQDSKTLLVWGGSQGAHSINHEVGAHLNQLLRLCQVIHICGSADLPWLQQLKGALVPELRPRYQLYPYLHEGMSDAMAAADLAISRSGASVLGEFTIANLPSILVPYPHAAAHQLQNARHLADAGAAMLLQEDAIQKLVPLALGLLQDDGRLRHMAEQAAALARPNAARDIAALLADMAHKTASIAHPHQPTHVR